MIITNPLTWARLALILFALGLTTPLPATENPALSGDKQVFLLDNKGKPIPIGTISFKPSDKGAAYELAINYQAFTDYFLSMKEMKCLEGPELWCHLRYPYKHENVVRRDDLRWLSHDLLFMFKKPKEFGANFWNGIYYDLRLEGDNIIGQAQAVDLNQLAAPPDDLTTPPYGEYDREDIEPSNRWLPGLLIQ